MRTAIFFMESLRRLSGDDLNLYQHPKVDDNTCTFALYGLTGRFGDGSGAVVGSPHLINKLTQETGNREAAWYRQEFLGAGESLFDIIWPRPTIEPEPPKVASKHFRTIDWVALRTEFKNPETVTIATKAGWLDDPHHGHLDCGNFILTWRDKPFIREIGSIPYDQKCFDDERWDYPQASSIGHNVVFVNGERQKSAKYKNTPWEEGVGGRVLDFRTAEDRDYVLMDPSGAYPGKELKGWRRHIVLDKPVVTVVIDEITCDPGDEIETRFQYDCELEVADTYALLKDSRGTMAVIPVVDAPFTITPKRVSYLPVKARANFTWIPCFGTVLDAPAEKTDIATIILPVKDGAEAAAVAASVTRETSSNGGMSLSFTSGGERREFRFAKTADGLILD